MEVNLKNNRGSITVEAALIFPIVILSLLAFLFLFEYLRAQLFVAEAISDITDELCSLGIPVEYCMNRMGENADTWERGMDVDKDGNDVTEQFAELAAEYIGEKALESLVKEKIKAADSIFSRIITEIDLSESTIYDQDWVEILCTYDLRNPVGMFSIPAVRISQKIRQRYFTGKKIDPLYEIQSPTEEEDESDNEEETEEREVYITETGTVYHLKLECPSLKINISEESLSDVPKLRNDGGAKYYPCELCAEKKPEVENVFITTDGNRYHNNLSCSGLKRTISKVKLSEVEEKRNACKRCNK